MKKKRMGGPLVGGGGKWYDNGVSRRAEPSPGVRNVSFPLGAKKEHAMKKTMLVLACAAVCVAGAETINSVGFENYTGSKLMSNGYDDFGGSSSDQVYFTYDASSGSEDGSTVVQHEGTPVAVKGTPTPEGFGEAYLSLSTEGGTLWRTIKPAEQVETKAGGVKWDATKSQEVPADTGLYIDTMVQFTPTEDGSEPEIGDDAKLAIWLNVATAEDGTATTNLCVKAGFLTDDGETTICTPKTYNLVGVNVVAGSWYRLTVKAIADFTTSGVAEGGWDAFLGFTVRLDEKLLSAAEPTVDESYIEAGLDATYGFLSETAKSLLESKTVFPCLMGAESVFQLSAVGFKGSGAIDDFLVTTRVPQYTEISTVDFTLTWDETVSSVTYTIEGGAAQSATKGTGIPVEPGAKVTVAATPADWYTITDGTGEFTVTENTTKTITAVLDSLAGLSITGFDSSVSTSDVKDWADAKKISLNDLKNNEFAYNSYLLNTGLLTADPVLTIDDVTVADGKMTITVAAKTSATDGGDSVDLENIKGVLYVKTGDTLDDMKSTTVQFGVQTGDNTTGDSKLTVTLDAGKFAQVKIGAKPPAAE